MFKYSTVQIPSLYRFPLYPSTFYSGNLEWKWNSVSAWYFRIPFGWETTRPPPFSSCWWVKTRLGAALFEPRMPHRFTLFRSCCDLLCFVHVVIYSVKHGMDAGSEITSNWETATTCIHHTVRQWIWKVTAALIKAMYQNIHKAAKKNHG